MTARIFDFSEIDLTGGLSYEGEAIASVHYNGERLWPFGPDLLYLGGVIGASYLPDAGVVYGATGLASFGDGLAAVLDQKAGVPVLGPELVANGAFGSDTGWTKGAGWAIGGGQASITSAASNSDLSQNIGAVTGRFYRVTFDYIASAAFNIWLGSSGGSFVTSAGTGTVSRIMMAAAGSDIRFRAGTGVSLTIDNVTVREVPGIPALQTSTSPRPLLGRAPKAGRRNLLTRTEEFADAVWAKANATIASKVAVTPQGADADKLVEATDSNLQHSLSLASFFGLTGPNTFSIDLKAAGRNWAVLNMTTVVGVLSTSEVRAWFNLQTGEVGTFLIPTGGSASAAILPLGDGWYRCSITINYAVLANRRPIVLTATGDGSAQHNGDGTSGILISSAQLEANSTATPYQRVGSAVDITEADVPSYPFIRPDLADDRLDTALPLAVTGDVVVAGRNGSIITPQAYAAGANFQLGPQTYTGGTPGILRAIGDIVGWSIFNKTLSAVERERLMRFYKRRGAKGLLVPGSGPELVTNGGFDSGLTGWTVGSGSLSWSAGAATIAGANNPDPFFNGAAFAVVTGRAYIISANIVSAGGTPSNVNYIRLAPGAGGFSLADGIVASSGLTGAFSAIVVAPAGWNGSARVVVQRGGNPVPPTTTLTVDNISVRELRPEEEW